ncbi:MAG: hypothetical protein JSV56_06935 [Methanomassiliicoccales archaeon]|nr:MAG: hypothetical protein JSV56_06935 [Methanomassiliicoccales archaeon]
MYEIIIWIGIVTFIAFIFAAVLLYLQSERFDKKYKKEIEVIRAIKTQKLRDFIMKYYEEESTTSKTPNAGDDFPNAEEYRKMGKKILEGNKNLNRLMKKSADLKMWFDYLPRAKEFLVNASLWLFLLGLAVLVFCLSVWAELESIQDIRLSGYLSFLWIFMGINFFKNILRYNLVTKNINKHMDMLREGEVEKF